jgi:two-component system, OmpR family, phosphate regulon sensor histidine kinase PhoR
MDWNRSSGIAGGVVLLCGALLAFLIGAPLLAITAGVLVGFGLALAAGIVWPTTPPPPAETVAVPSEPRPIERQVDDLLHAVDDPLLLVEGRTVVRANAAARKALGEHVVGEDIRLAIRHPAAAELLARSGPSSQGSVEIIGLGDADRRWTMSVQPLGGGTRVVRLVDRTANHATERMRVDFVANASHELRTPLASLIGFIETLEDANGPDEAVIRQRFLGIMAGEARRMQRLVDDLISLSRIEADKHRAPSEAVSLAALARETADTLRGTRDAPRRIELSIEDRLPPVAGDRAQLSQLLHNLIGNGLKYGDPTKPVRIGIARGGPGMIRLAVADEGEGIASQHLPRLTERFYRVDTGRSRAVGGTGLGLAIVKHIVERHRGRLDIASTKGVGTTVTVMLPIQAEAMAAAAE